MFKRILIPTDGSPLSIETLAKAARFAKDAGANLIVMASHGRGGVSAVVLGSETLKVLTHSKTPVLVYR